MAKLTKTRVPEFGVGIPPRVVGKRWKGVLWSLNSIPLGGFVRIYGDGDAGDSALDALGQIEKNIINDGSKATKNLKKDAVEDLKSQYTAERFSELAQNQELDYFLESQGLNLTQEWKDQIKAKNLDDEKTEQIKTLISWEFDGLPKNKDLFYNKPFWAKILIMLGGVTANFLLAWGILTVLLSFFSISPFIIPDVPLQISGINFQFISKQSSDKLVRVNDNTDMIVIYVEKDSLAEKTGIKPQDKIISLNDQKFSSTTDFVDTLARLGGNQINLKIQDSQNGNLVDKQIDLPVKQEGKPQLGITPFQLYTYKASNFWEASGIALDIVWNVSISLILLLGGILTAAYKLLFRLEGDTSIVSAVSGPVAIGAQGNQIFTGFGVNGVITTIALLSVNLGVFNLLPIPALDGGRILILSLQKITGKRNRRMEYIVVSVTFILLILLSLLIAYLDITKLRTPNNM
jgi:regulator of sigma E protease